MCIGGMGDGALDCVREAMPGGHGDEARAIGAGILGAGEGRGEGDGDAPLDSGIFMEE